MRYTWKPEKNLQNIAKHGVAFADVVAIFDGLTIERVDDRFEYGEVRVQAIGLVNGMEFTVVYTDHDGDTRHIITAWRALPHERRYYWKNVQV